MPQVLTLGAPGEEIALELTLRVVADIGLVVWLLLHGFWFIFSQVARFMLIILRVEGLLFRL